MDGGHRAVIFDRFAGIKKQVIGEGTHFFIPWVQKPVIFDVRSRPRNIPVITGSKGKALWFYVNLYTKHLRKPEYLFLFLLFYENIFSFNRKNSQSLILPVSSSHWLNIFQKK